MQASARLKRADENVGHPPNLHAPQHTAYAQALKLPVRSPGATADNHSKLRHHRETFYRSCFAAGTFSEVLVEFNLMAACNCNTQRLWDVYFSMIAVNQVFF